MLNINDLTQRMAKTILSFKGDLSGLRTNRASTNLLDSITVDAYGSVVPLNQVANISVPEPRMLLISVWDKTMISAVERAIRESKLGINPIVDGTNLRLPLPDLTTERRKELIKIAQQYAEQARVAIRHIRRDGMDSLKKSEKSQDEIRTESDKIQKLTDENIESVDKILEDKSKEIMQI